MKLHLPLALALLFGAVSVSHAQCDAVDLALGHPAVASSIETSGFPASAAVDADTTGSRWSSFYSDAQWIYVDLGSVFDVCQVKLYWETALGKNFTIDISSDALSWTTAATVTGNTSYQNTISVTGRGRYVRMNGTLRGTGWGYSLYAFKVYAKAGYAGASNVALGKTATASSTAAGSAAGAFDGNTATYWQSAVGNGYTLTVDLGSVQTIETVGLSFNSNYATDYSIAVSNDNVSWTNTVTVNNNSGPTLSVNAIGSGRYVRFVGLGSYFGLGYSIKEMTVNAMSFTLPVSFVHFTAQKQLGSVALDWTVGMTSPDGTFSVERSVNGAAFAAIGSVAFTSGDDGDFHWVDDAAVTGTDAYRIKETDADGEAVYSAIATVDLSDAASAGLYLYPNPAKDYVIVANPNNNIVHKIELLSVEGRRCLLVEAASTGSVRIPLSGLPVGIYWVRVGTESGTTVLRVVTR